MILSLPGFMSEEKLKIGAFRVSFPVLKILVQGASTPRRCAQARRARPSVVRAFSGRGLARSWGCKCTLSHGQAASALLLSGSGLWPL